jgi:uncharacterized protein YndB with AHSA1/START domain
MPDTETPVISEHRIEIRRTFEAPLALVWEAWTDPDQLTKWWGPKGFTTPRDSITMDVRPGGVFALTMVGPDGSRFDDNGHFQEVVEHQRLAFGGDVPNMDLLKSAYTEVTFTDLGDGRTEVFVVSTMMAADIMPEMARQGWSSQFDKLDELLAVT